MEIHSNIIENTAGVHSCEMLDSHNFKKMAKCKPDIIEIGEKDESN